MPVATWAKNVLESVSVSNFNYDIQDRSKLVSCNQNKMTRTTRNSTRITTSTISCEESKSNRVASREAKQQDKGMQMDAIMSRAQLQAVVANGRAAGILRVLVNGEKAEKGLQIAASISCTHQQAMAASNKAAIIL